MRSWLPTLQRMYRTMVRARTFDTKAVNLQRTGKLGTYPSCLGQEAAHVGVGAAMRPRTCYSPCTGRSAPSSGAASKCRLLLYWGGDERGTTISVRRRIFLSACRSARRCRTPRAPPWRSDPRRARAARVAFIGDGGTSQGAFYEAINFAGARSLPLVCVIVNNGWAISVPVAAQTAAQTLAQKAHRGGHSGAAGGRQRHAGRARGGRRGLERARAGGGPTVIEALTYRLSDHTTSDDATRYRERRRGRRRPGERADRAHARIS